jgi:peptidoglycan/LPS O-acetylase OafA/YrhL
MAVSLSAPKGSAPQAPDLPALTGVRFLLAFWVLLYHAARTLTGADGYVLLMSHGYLGVDIFFVISGFILAHVYRRRFEAGEPGIYRHFLWLRFARIWPAYAVALLFTAAFEFSRAKFGSGVVKIDLLPWSWELLRHLAMVQSWGLADFWAFNLPGWSLSAEWMGYLAFPVFLALVRPLRGAAARLLAMAAAFMLLYLVFRWLSFKDLDEPGDAGMLRLAVEFFAGIVLASFMPANAPTGRGDVPAFAGAACGFLMLALVGRTAPLAGDVLSLPCFVVAMWGCAQGGPWLDRLLANRTMLFLGAASYSIYLMQDPVTAIIGLGAPKLGVVPAAWMEPTIAFTSMIASIAAGCLLLVMVERPARDFLRCFGLRRFG